MSLALREQKGVFPKDADNVFLPAGRQVELILKSEDRVPGTAINDALFYLNPPIYGVQSVGLGSFTMFNLFPNITATTRVLTGAPDNVLAVTADAPVPAQVVFPEGRWQCGLGRVTNAMVREDNSTNLNDIRYFLLRSYLQDAAEDDCLWAATLDPVTGLLKLEWNPAYTAVNPIVVNPLGGSLWKKLGFTNTTTTLGSPNDSVWQATNVLDLGDPLSVAIQSQFGQLNTNSVFQSASLGGSSRTNYIAVVPITVPPYGVVYYEPYTSLSFSTMRNSRPLTDVRVQFINPVTQEFVVMSPQQQWQLKLILNIVD